MAEVDFWCIHAGDKQTREMDKTYVSVTDHKCSIGISSIFDTVFLYLPIFLTVLRYWVSPNVPLNHEWQAKETKFFFWNLIGDLKLNPLSKFPPFSERLFSEKAKLDRNSHTHAGRQGLTWNFSPTVIFGFWEAGVFKLVVFQNLIMIYFPRIFLLPCPKGKTTILPIFKNLFPLSSKRNTCKGRTCSGVKYRFNFTFRQGDYIVAPNQQNVCEQAAKNPGGIKNSHL